MIKPPYLLFLGSAQQALDCKTARGILHWRPDHCLGQLRLPDCSQSLSISDFSIEAAAAQGARTLVIGTVSAGGILPASWLPLLRDALASGLDLAAGMHQRLADQPELVELANQHSRLLLDVRDPEWARQGLLNERPWSVGSGKPRSGDRILTVGTDCSVGKMYSALAFEQGLRQAGVDAEFKATGQTGILIAGSGVPVDAMVSDFIAGSVETLSPNDPARTHVIEGQGSLHHPAFAGVSLGLLHGAQPDGLVVCHEPTRRTMRHVAHLAPPTLQETVDLNLTMARRTNPDVRVVGFSINTSELDEATARQYLADVGEEFDLPAVDPVRDGVEPLVDSWLAS